MVDDDGSMRESLARLLGIAGFDCVAFASAEALLAGESEAGAACIVSDWRLPGVSGPELLAELRRAGRTTPVILITAHDAPGRREEAIGRGAAAYLVKPFRGTELLAQIATIVGMERPSEGHHESEESTCS